MKNRKLIVLSIVTLAVIVAAGITAKLRAPQSTFSRQALFPELAGRINDVSGITIKGNKGTVVLQQQGEQWVLASADNYPALFNMIKRNVVGMAELKIVDEKTDNPGFYKQLGVEGPEIEGTKSMLMTFKDKSGHTMAALIVGNKRQSSSNKPGLYVRKPDASRALLVEGDLDISDEPSHWFESHLFDIPSAGVQKVTISYPRTGEQPPDDLVLLKDTRDQPDFTVNIPSLDKEPNFNIIASRISRGLEEMRGENVHSLRSFNFPENDTITTTVSTFDGLVVTARLVKKDRLHYANFTFAYNPPVAADKTGTPNTPGTTKAPAPDAGTISPRASAETLNRNLSPWVFEIPDFLYEALTTRPDQFRKLKLMPGEE
jgi:hypothetical protein